MSDREQLAAYIQRGDEDAFASLMSRHIGLVYGAAYRLLGDPGRAEEVTQAAFLSLAQKPPKLTQRSSLSTWLYSTASHKAIDVLRQEAARKRREESHAKMMHDQSDNHEPRAVWQEIAPVLEEAMQSLGEGDRTAMLLRYFEERPLREVSQVLGISEAAARKRVSRALARLRAWYAKRGFTGTSSALAVALGAYAVEPLPATTTSSAIQTVLAQASATPTTATATLASTLMTMKLTLLTGLIAGVALPLSLGYLEERDQDAAPLPVSLPSPAFEIALPEPAMSELMAEWVKMRDRHGPDSGSMPEFYEAIEDLDDDFRRRAFRTAFIAEWATLHPREALEHFHGKKDGRRSTDVLRIWLENDPSEAIAAMIRTGPDLGEPIADVLEDVAEQAPHELARLAPLAKGRFTNPVQEAFAIAARANLNAMRTAALGVEGPARKQALAGVAQAWAESDGPVALTWAQALEPSEDRSRTLRHLLIGWAQSDPGTALDHLHLAPPGGSSSNQMITERLTSELVLEAAAQADFDGTLAWLSENPNPFETDSLMGLNKPLHQRLIADLPATLAMIRDHEARSYLENALGSVLMNDGAGQMDEAWNWATAEPAGEFTSALKRRLIGNVISTDPDKALAWARALVEEGDTESIDYSTLASHLVHQPEDLERLDDVFLHAPQEVQDKALMWALTRRRHSNLDHESWLGWIDQLPREQRDRTVALNASQLVANDPTLAVAWADKLPDSDRIKAYEGLTKTWSESDSYEASQWIASLPESLERDHATLTLVNAIARGEPDSAWQWAQTIQSPSPRTKALQKALLQFPGAAREVLDQSNLDPGEKARMATWLDGLPSHITSPEPR